jgi:hypothetical protein
VTAELGATVSIDHVDWAGVASVLPAPSTARTLKVWLPSERLVYAFGLVQAPKPPPSSSHSKVEPPSLAEKEKVASAEAEGFDGPESTVVFGATLSIVKLLLGPVSVLPALSWARTWTV